MGEYIYIYIPILTCTRLYIKRHNLCLWCSVLIIYIFLLKADRKKFYACNFFWILKHIFYSYISFSSIRFKKNFFEKEINAIRPFPESIVLLFIYWGSLMQYREIVKEKSRKTCIYSWSFYKSIHVHIFIIDE